MGSNSRYDRDRPVGDREDAVSRALHMIGELAPSYPGITSRSLALQVAGVLQVTGVELGTTTDGWRS